MEERVAPSAEDDPHLQSSRPEPTTPTTNDNHFFLQLPPPPGHDPLATYVIQVPKDHIYRIPPPENARIVETYHKAAAEKVRNKKKSYLKHLIWMAIVLVVIGVIIGVTLAVLYHSFTPKAPIFSVSKLHVTQFVDGSPPKFDVTLKVRNPNEKMGIQYRSDEDDAKLIFLTKTLGSGRFPILTQKSGDSNVVHVNLIGPDDRSLPPNVQRSMNDKKQKHEISLVLKFNSPLLLNVWIFKLWSRDMDVQCNFRVSTMGQGAKILTQNCKTKLS